MHRLILPVIIFVLASNVDCLWLTKNRPGALPVLAKQINKKPGLIGVQAYDLSDPEEFENLEHLVLLALDYVQGTDQGNFSNPNRQKYKTHKLIDIKEANDQLVSGNIYEVIFTVGERNCEKKAADKSANGRPRRGCTIAENGQYGRCYFKLYYQAWTNKLEIDKKSTCVETNRKDATF